MITNAMWKVILVSGFLIAMTMINLPDDGQKIEAPDFNSVVKEMN